MKTKAEILVFIFSITWMLTCFVNSSLAQDSYSITNFSSKDGLPNNHVNDIVCDKTGFLWIATWDGLSRFDGYEFRNYYHNPQDSTSMPFAIVFKMEVDKCNNLWLRSLSGRTYQFDRENECFIQDRRSPALVGNDMSIDKNGEFWKINTADGLEKYDYSSRKFIAYNIEDQYGKRITFEKDGTIFLSFDKNNCLWIFTSTNEVLTIYSGTLKKDNKLVINGIFANGLKNTYDKNPGDIVVRYFPKINTPGLNQKFPEEGIFIIDKTRTPLSKTNALPDLSKFKNTPQFVWSVNNNRFQPYDDDYRKLYNIELQKDECTRTFYKDTNGNLWYYNQKGMGEGNGLTRCIPVSGFFKHYLLEYDKTNNTNAFFSVIKDRNSDIWASIRNQPVLFRIKPNGKILEYHYPKEPKWWDLQHARSMCEDSTGIWIGFFRDNLRFFDFKSGKLKDIYTYKPQKNYLEDYQIFKDLIKIDNRYLYIFGAHINEYDPVENKIRELVTISEKGNGYCLIEDGNQGYWAGFSLAGIKHYDKQFRETGSWEISGGLYNVEDICTGDNEDLWIALLGGGLVHLHPKTGRSETYTTAHGLSNNTCYCILKDRKGNLWITTNHGISRFNPVTRQFRIFGPSDGLKIDEFNSDAKFLSEDGEMFFGGMGGIVGFYPDSLQEYSNSTNSNPLEITDFRVSGTTRHFDKAIYNMDSVTLRKGEDNFQVNFACLDFRHGNKIKYRYRLNGEDKSYIETDSRHRFVNYASLAPGDYTLSVESTNPDGDWVSNTKLLVRIPPLYYQTLWFKLMVILGILLIITIFILMLIRQFTLKASRKQAELRLESLRGQMNPHFIFNSLNSINYFISQNDRLSANRYIADFSRLIRSFLGNLSKDYIPFTSEFETIQDYLQLEHLRFGNKFDYSLETEEGFEPESKMIFPGMVQPFIENAIWHGIRGPVDRKGFVKVRFLAGGDDYCVCIVEDDGIGRKLSEERKSQNPGKKSNGIAIVLERLKIINQLKQKNLRLIIEDLHADREETGTRVIVEIPVQPINQDF